MTTITEGGCRIDDTSQVVLQILRDRREPMTTGDLRRQTRKEQNQSIRHRFENHLLSAGLAKEAGKQETPGNGPDASLWTITDEGRQWLDEHAESLQTATDAARAITSLRRTQQTVDSLSDNVSDIEGRIERWQDTMNDRSKMLNRFDQQRKKWKNDVTDQGDEAWNRAQTALTKAKNAHSRVDELESTVDTLEENVDEMGDEIDELRHQLEEHDSRISKNENRLTEVKEKIEKAARVVKNTQTTVKENRETAQEALSRSRSGKLRRLFSRR